MNELIKNIMLKMNDFNNIDYQMVNISDYNVISYKIRYNGSSLRVKYKNIILGTFYTNLFGIKGLLKALELIAFCYQNGIDLKIAQSVLSDYKEILPITFKKHNIIVIISDAASLNDVNELLKSVAKIKHNKTIVVGGATSYQIKERKSYGQLLSNNSDILILTENDSSYEGIFSILADTTRKITKDYYIEPNRAKAIFLARRLAVENDIIVILGKGNNHYNKILNTYYYHDDLRIIKKALDSQSLLC